jgi:hypothetical protein
MSLNVKRLVVQGSVKLGSPAPAGWTWDQQRSAVDLVISDGGRTVADFTYGEGIYNGSSLGNSVIAIASERKMFTVKVLSATQYMFAGFANASFNVESSLLGFNSVGVRSDGTVYNSDGSVQTDSCPAFTSTNDVVDIACSPASGGKWWYRVNGGVWSSVYGGTGGDPATDSQGFFLTTTATPGIIYPAVTPNYNASIPGVWTILGTPGGSVPAGYTFVA